MSLSTSSQVNTAALRQVGSLSVFAGNSPRLKAHILQVAHLFENRLRLFGAEDRRHQVAPVTLMAFSSAILLFTVV